MTTMTSPTAPRSAGAALFELMGSVASRFLLAAAELGVAEALAKGPMTGEELAKATGSDASSLARLLRVLAPAGHGGGARTLRPHRSRRRRDVDAGRIAGGGASAPFLHAAPAE